ATEIRDLHFRAHPSLAVEFRESYAGDTFIRCLLEKWQIKLRDSGGASLREYLACALELEKRDKFKSEIHCPLGRSAAFLARRQRQVEEVNVSVEETPAAGEESGASGEPRRCFFCDRVGHIKVNCWRYTRWKEEDEDGDSDSDGQSTSGKKKKMSQVKAKIPEGNPSKGVP
ncbi:MAG: hypothetical protein GY696_12590, partial [Gammaproteobacteria bacterium]|nr:hypothetical protein [Gammaproteobacteria bacterium]